MNRFESADKNRSRQLSALRCLAFNPTEKFECSRNLNKEALTSVYSWYLPEPKREKVRKEVTNAASKKY